MTTIITALIILTVMLATFMVVIFARLKKAEETIDELTVELGKTNRTIGNLQVRIGDVEQAVLQTANMAEATEGRLRKFIKLTREKLIGEIDMDEPSPPLDNT